MIQSIRSATCVACCCLVATLMQGGRLTLAKTPCLHACPVPCGGDCICIPNARYFGYFPTTWRQWPGEPRPEINFPQSVGIEAIPTPPGEEQLPLPEAIPDTVPTPEEGILSPGGGFPGPSRVPVEPEATPPIGTLLPEALPGLPQEPTKPEEGTELPGTLPGLPIGPESIPAEKPIETPAEEPLDSPFEREPIENPFETSLDGAYQPYFMSQLPVMVPEESANPPEKVVQTPMPLADVPQRLAKREPLVRPLPKSAEGQPARLDHSPAARPLGTLAEEPFESVAPLQARPNEPQALSAPGEAIAEPILPDELQPSNTEPPGHAKIEPPGRAKVEPAGRAKIEPPGRAEIELPEHVEIESPDRAEIELLEHAETESPKANWAMALTTTYRGGSDRGVFANDHSVPMLDGYCPVELIEKERWTAGNSGLSAVHNGRTFFFSNSGAHQRFLADPDQYAPTYRGRDPVLLLDEGRHVAGQTDYCITCNGRLYAFSCEETLQQFQKDPQKYAVAREE